MHIQVILVDFRSDTNTLASRAPTTPESTLLWCGSSCCTFVHDLTIYLYHSHVLTHRESASRICSSCWTYSYIWSIHNSKIIKNIENLETHPNVENRQKYQNHRISSKLSRILKSIENLENHLKYRKSPKNHPKCLK